MKDAKLEWRGGSTKNWALSFTDENGSHVAIALAKRDDHPLLVLSHATMRLATTGRRGWITVYDDGIKVSAVRIEKNGGCSGFVRKQGR